mgnify:CR=1 FL=1
MLRKLLVSAVFLFPMLVAADVIVTRSDFNGVAFRYKPGPIRLERVKTEVQKSAGQVSIEFPDADHLAQPGGLDLPVKIVRVGIPQTGGVRLKVKTGPVETFNNVVVGTTIPLGMNKWHNTNSSGFVPAKVAEVDTGQQFRDVRFAEVRLSPVQYDPDGRVLSSYDWIDVEVSFEEKPFSNFRSEPLDRLISRLLVNGKQAVGWKVPEQTGQGNFFQRAPHWVKVRICTTGIYSISGKDLENLGVMLAGIEPTTLSLYNLGEHVLNGPYPDTMLEVPILVQGEEDGRFDPDDRIVFYGLGPDHWVGRCSVYVNNYFTRGNVYWLAWGGVPGRRIARGLGPDTTGTPVIRVAEDVLHQEQDLECPGRAGLLWVWKTIIKDSYRNAVSFDANLKLAYPVRIHGICGRLFSKSSGNELNLYLNHRLINTVRFGIRGASQPFDFAVDTTLPVSFDRNRLTFELCGQGEKNIYLDYVEVRYTQRLSLCSGHLHFLFDDTGSFRFSIRDVKEAPVILDVSDHYAPKMSDGFEWDGNNVRFCRRLTRPVEFSVANRFLHPECMKVRRVGLLTNPGLRADYWVVTPKEFLAPAQKLARYRSGRIAGIAQAQVAVATLEDIYDNYSFGIEEPGAIKWFFADKRPVYGLLAGDATYDYKNILGFSKNPGVPAYEYGLSLDPSGRGSWTAVGYDAWYADFEGSGGSPDMALGRVTARTPAEFSRFVEKLKGYDNGPAGLWNKRFILLADDEWKHQGKPDLIGFGHIRQAEEIGVLPGNLMEPVKVYLTEYPFVGATSKPEADKEIMRQLKRGALLMVFFGHGDAFILAHGSIFEVSEIERINNGSRLPFCFFGSCSVGRFEDTRYECIAEEMVRKPDGGAIATVGASKATASNANKTFARNLLVPIFNDSFHVSTIGMAFLEAWPTNRIYHLFGDPATRLRSPKPSTQGLVVSPDILQPGASFKVRSILEVPKAQFSWSFFGPWRMRRYVSECGVAFYTLPGIELARGNGRVQEGRFSCQGLFPLGIPLDTVYVANGFYAPVQRSCRISASVWNDSVDLSVLRDTITYDTEPAVVEDKKGPDVCFFFGKRIIEDGMRVPRAFEVEGVIKDPAGIMIAPVPGRTPRFFVSGQENVNLTDLLVFDDSSSTTARFKVKVKLDNENDTIFVIVYDNLLNRTFKSVAVRPLVSGAALAVESVLVYPNPVKKDAIFTFSLNRAANVRVRIFTLQGRFICDLGKRPAVFGYNQMAWNGRDSDGSALPNGVYLFSLSAHTVTPGQAETVTVRGQFLVLR